MWNRCEVVCREVSLREAWSGPPDSAVGCATSLFRGAESSYLVSWGLSREPMMLVPQPTMVSWGFSIWGSSELSVGDRVLVGGCG